MCDQKSYLVKSVGLYLQNALRYQAEILTQESFDTSFKLKNRNLAMQCITNDFNYEELA